MRSLSVGNEDDEERLKTAGSGLQVGITIQMVESTGMDALR